MFLTGAFGGVKLFIHPIKGAHPDVRSWRLYFAPRMQGVDRDRARPTNITKPAAQGWAGVQEHRRLRGLNKTLAAVGLDDAVRSRYDLQRDLGFDLDDDSQT